VKKVLYLVGSIFFGYVGLAGIAFSMNPSKQDVPSGLLLTMGIIGVIGLFLMRFFWKKFRVRKN